jgi:hypothetical protein
MALVKLKDICPERDTNNDTEIAFDTFSVYAEADEKVGSVNNVLVDEQEGLFRYLIVDTGFWVLGKKVLLPIGLARFDFDNQRVYVNGLTKKQVEDLPEFTDDLKLDQDYEERVRGVYRPLVSDRTPVATDSTYSGDNYSYAHDPHLYRWQGGDRVAEYEKQLVERQMQRTPQ